MTDFTTQRFRPTAIPAGDAGAARTERSHLREAALGKAFGPLAFRSLLRGAGLAATLGAFSALTPPAAAVSTMPDIDLKIDVRVPLKPISVGAESEAIVTLSPPSGVHLNQYPPIRLTLDASPPLVFSQKEIKMGLDKMPKDLDANPFEKVDPIRVKFKVGAHSGDAKIPVTATLKYFYCVAKSGYCAPGTKTISFSVPITGP